MRIFAPVALRHIGLIWARGPLGRLVGLLGRLVGPWGRYVSLWGRALHGGECAFLWLERHFGGLCCKLGLSFPIMG